MSVPNDKIISKLAKLKAKMESCQEIGSEAEAAVFARKLRQLLLEHNIELAQLDKVEEEPIGEFSVDWHAAGFKTINRRRAWTEALANIVTKAYSCRIIVEYYSDTIYLVGTPTNAALAEYALVTIRRMAELVCRKRWIRYRDRLKNRNELYIQAAQWKNGFLLGLVRRLKERFEEMEARQNTGIGKIECTALLRMDNDFARAGSYIDNDPFVKKAKGVKWGNCAYDGERSGKRFANNLDLAGKAVNRSSQVTRNLER